jgi:hypothetical protein
MGVITHYLRRSCPVCWLPSPAAALCCGSRGYFTYPRQFNPAGRSRGTPIVVMETTQHRDGDNVS